MGFVITILAVSLAIVAAFTGVTNWQGRSEKHAISAQDFEYLAGRVAQMKFHGEQSAWQMTDADCDMLKDLYGEAGYLYEQSPSLRWWSRKKSPKYFDTDNDVPVVSGVLASPLGK